jgi:hypothetical protein
MDANVTTLKAIGFLVDRYLWPMIENKWKKEGPHLKEVFLDRLNVFAEQALTLAMNGGRLNTTQLISRFQNEFDIQLSGAQRGLFLQFIEGVEDLSGKQAEAMSGVEAATSVEPLENAAEPPVLEASASLNLLPSSQQPVQINPMNEKDLKNKVVNWIVPSALIARKLSWSSLTGFLGAGGVMIEEGTKAAILINGVVQHEVGPGIYQFDRHKKGQTDESPSTFLDLLTGIFGKTGIRLLPDGSTEFKKDNTGTIGIFAKDVTSYSVVICRSSPFECQIEVSSGRGGDQKTIDLLVQINSVGDFLRWAMTNATDPLSSNQDANLSIDSLRPMIQRRFGDQANTILEQGIAGVSADLESSLRREWQRLGGDTGLSIVNILRLYTEAQRNTKGQVSKLRETEELLDVEIRLQKANNKLGLGLALAEEERQQIEAELEKKGLARSFDLEKFGRDVESQRLVVEHSINLLDTRMQGELAQQKMELQAKLDTRAATVMMDLARMREIGEAQIKADAETIQRTAQIELDDKERKLRLDGMKDLMDIRKSRDKSAAEDEREKLRIFKDMTPEQIMLINPNVAREAAEAMAKKFSSDHSEKTAEMALAQADKMKEFLEKMAEEQRKIVAAAISTSKQTAAEINKSADNKVNQVAKLSRAVKGTPSKSEQKEDQESDRGKKSKEPFSSDGEEDSSEEQDDS